MTSNSVPYTCLNMPFFVPNMSFWSTRSPIGSTYTTDSSDELKLLTLSIGIPLSLNLPKGRSLTLTECITPLLVKTHILPVLRHLKLILNSSSTASLLRSYVGTSTVLAYPNLSIRKTTSISSAFFSSYTTSTLFSICVFRSLPYCFLIRSRSFIIAASILAGLVKSSLYSAISLSVLLCSATSASISRPISLYSLISRMADACLSLKVRLDAIFSDILDLNVIPSVVPDIRQALAVLTSLLPRSISMMTSIISTALIRPSCISFLSSSLDKSVLYLRVESSLKKLT